MSPVYYLNVYTTNIAKNFGGFPPRPGAAPDETGHNDSYDAYRHAMVSAWITDRLGALAAKQMMDKHEIENPNPAPERNMDLYNNNVGRTEYHQWKHAKDSGASTDSLEKWIYDAVKRGATINEPNDPQGRVWGEQPEMSDSPDPFPGGDPFTGMPWPGDTGIISPILGTTPDPLVKTIHYRFVDPLVLDLDGDGLEITPLAAGVLFDANGDTIKTATAWVGSDDGLLALDRDGNGSIDSGRELFGDETILSNGTKAAHGFAALAELDTGSVVNGVTVGAGDGVFDALDSAYSAVRVWTDANQDGIGQAAELQTLADSGVSAITLASAAPNTNYGDAVLVRSGTFTRADGSNGQAGSFILAQNNFVREFAPIAPSEAAQALPDIGGSGASAQARADGYGLMRVTNAGFGGNRPPKCRRKRKLIGFDGHLSRIPAWNGHGQLSNLKCFRARGVRSLCPSAVRGCVPGARLGARQLNEKTIGVDDCQS